MGASRVHCEVNRARVSGVSGWHFRMLGAAACCWPVRGITAVTRAVMVAGKFSALPSRMTLWCDAALPNPAW